MKKTIAVLVTALMLGTTRISLAQDANGNNPAMSPKARLERQHDRVEKGVDNGSISKKEHRKLAKQGHKINKERKADLKKDGGKLDKQDRKKLEKQENKRSHEIYKDKHD